jgi:signal transduction histidine kinase
VSFEAEMVARADALAPEDEQRSAGHTEERVLLEELVRIDVARERSLAVVSHELRGQMQAILAWTEQLRGGGRSPASQRKALKIIERSVCAQADLVENLFEHSRLHARKPMVRRTVKLDDVVTVACEALRPIAEDAGVGVVAQVDRIAIDGEPLRLHRVVVNLLGNAIRHSPRGSTIRAVLRREPTEAVLSIIDQGAGIPEDALERIFQRFEQVGERPNQGLGLGLHIVREIVTLHGGTVAAQSEGEGHGATLVVRLPLGRSAAAAVR